MYERRKPFGSLYGVPYGTGDMKCGRDIELCDERMGNIVILRGRK